MNLQFVYNTRAELLKTRRTGIIWLTLLGAAFMPAINCIILLNRPDVFVPKLQTACWQVLLHMNWKTVASIFLPLYVILLNNAIAQIEFRNHGWKQVYALPRRYTDIFFSKFLVVLIYLFCFLVLVNACIVAAGLVTGWLNPRYPFAANPLSFGEMGLLTVRIAWGVLGITALQYWLSLRFSNYLVPLGIGIGLLLAGIILMDWDKIIHYPYVYPIFLFFSGVPDRTATLKPLLIDAGAAFLVAVTAACIDSSRRKIKG